MSDPPVIRSYQRIFSPERRLYQIDGRRIPVPGGVPLRWLAYEVSALLAVVVLSTRSLLVTGLVAAATGVAGLAAGGREAGAVAAVAAGVGMWVAGFVVSTLDWPLRFVVLPALVATLGTQATPDGRRADRFAVSWLLVRLAGRRSVGRTLPPPEHGRVHRCSVWVAPDGGGSRLRRARVRGPATLLFGEPVVVRRGRRRRLLVRPARSRRTPCSAGRARVQVEAGMVAEVRP